LILGSGPNGLAAGIVLAEAVWSVRVVEGAELDRPRHSPGALRGGAVDGRVPRCV